MGVGLLNDEGVLGSLWSLEHSHPPILSSMELEQRAFGTLEVFKALHTL